MGLFDKVLGKDGGTISYNKQEAFSAVALAAVASDGVVTQDEFQRLVVNLGVMPAFRKWNARDLGDALQKIASQIQKRGVGPVMDAAKSALGKEQIDTAFFIAADLVLADGTVEPEEKKFLEDLQQTLGVSEETATKIVEVVVIKNR